MLTGATHSFISYAFTCYVDMPTKPLDLDLSIITCMGDCLMVDCVYKSCVISICDREFLVDLIHMEMCDFDLILGMDWLHVLVDVLLKIFFSFTC